MKAKRSPEKGQRKRGQKGRDEHRHQQVEMPARQLADDCVDTQASAAYRRNYIAHGSKSPQTREVTIGQLMREGNRDAPEARFVGDTIALVVLVATLEQI